MAVSPKPVTVHIDVTTALRVHTMATNLAKAYDGNDGHYGNGNNYHMQLVGKIGEEAVARMFDLAKIEYLPWFRDNDMQACADLKLPGYHDQGVAIEVKTWVRSQWEELGRAVREKYYDRVRKRTDALIWCTFNNGDFSTEKPFAVQIMGFNSMVEFDMSKKLYKDGNSYQVDLCLPMARFGDYLGDKQR